MGEGQSRSRENVILQVAVLAIGLVLLGVSPVLAEGDEVARVAEGHQIGIEYTLKLEDGSTVDSNVGRAPLVYTQGKQEILGGLQQALAGLAVDDAKQVTLAPEDAYGAVNPKAVITVASEKIPEESRFVGAVLGARDAEGHQRRVRVKEVREKEVVLDLNHPLAGKTLIFDVKILSIK